MSASLAQSALSNDMRSVRSKFIAEWKAFHAEVLSHEDTKDVQKKASDAWLCSELRAQMLAARQSQQY